MSESLQRSRSFLWLWGLLTIAVAATLAAFVSVRLQLTEEERRFVGTWWLSVDDETSMIEIRPDRTVVTEVGYSQNWAVHGGQLVVWVHDDRTELRRFWDRMVGAHPVEGSADVDHLSDDRIVLSMPGMPTLELRRVGT